MYIAANVQNAVRKLASVLIPSSNNDQKPTSRCQVFPLWYTAIIENTYHWRGRDFRVRGGDGFAAVLCVLSVLSFRLLSLSTDNERARLRRGVRVFVIRSVAAKNHMSCSLNSLERVI